MEGFPSIPGSSGRFATPLSRLVAKSHISVRLRYRSEPGIADVSVMRTIATSALCCLALAVPILAQGPLVVPKTMANVEGVGGALQPFGFGQPMRYMCIYNSEELPFSGPTLMTGLWLRADHSTVPPDDSFAAKQFVTISIQISTSTARAETANAKFGDFHGPDLSLLLAGANVALPPQPSTLGSSGVPAPRPFNIPFIFKNPTFFDVSPIRTPYGTVPRSLVVDFIISSQPTGNYLIDSPLVCSSRIRWFGKQGPRCVTSVHRQPLDISCDDSLKAGGTVTFTVNEIPPGNPFAVILGTSSSGTWKGLPLPVDLTPFGGYDCFVNVDWVATSSAQADAQGVGRASFSIPSGRYVVGLELLAQALAYDISANPLLATTSLGIGTTVCGPLGVARLSNLGNATATTGTYAYGSCMIFEVR